ncbi:histidine phosphatase family protein [Streptomyces sp. H27-D2]|uniref:histidine phosphatase family protein n=1 Tax=Streptomyces sp. H27-D2 TaxID=3046304 RepID=UPI002DB71AF7|nr:histidine phosphatase family protein [Streptomyces sp. H27-D2]MEC4018597.1 histidine phosphatase family protein [Streptomyces sp. H27-D2]
MTVRVILISPAMSAAMREARFDDDSPLDAVGLRQAEAAYGTLPAGDRVFASPTTRCRRTAEALGVQAEPHAALRPCAMGRWRGRLLDELTASEPEAVTAWLSDPAAAPHGGESLDALCARVAGWFDELSGDSGRVIAVAEPDVVRAAVVHALGTPVPGFWRIDVLPLTLTELSGRAGRWNLRSGRALAPARNP